MKYTPSQEVECYLVVPPQYADQVFAPMRSVNGGNLRCLLSYDQKANTIINNLQDGTSEQVKFGDDNYNPSIRFNSASRESIMALEYIRKNNIPVYIYPKVGGTVQYSVPLIRGLGVDPLDTDLTDLFSLDADTRMYLPHAVSGRGHYFTEVTDGVPLLQGIYTDNGVNSDFPLGRGYAMFKPQKNLIKMSDMNVIDHSAITPPDGWRTNSTGWGTTHGQGDSKWLPGEKTWWTTAVNTKVLVSYKFDILSNLKNMNFSCSYLVDGTFKIELFDSASNLLGSYTVGWGEGRLQRTFATLGGSKTDCTIHITMTSGTYMRIGHCQLINGGTVPVTEYLPYLSTASAVQGELDNSGLNIAGDFSASYQKGQSASGGTDSAIAVSGYYQPAWRYTTTPGSTIVFLERFLTSSQGDVELKVFYSVTVAEFALYTGGTRRAGTIITGHEEGDIYAWVLYTGRLAASAGRTGFNIVRLRDGTSFSDSFPGIGFTYLNRLYIGCRSTAGNQCDGIIGGVSVDAVSYSDASKIADRLGDPGIADLFRRTAGRWYHLLQWKDAPHQYSRETWRGVCPLEQMRTI